MNLAFRKDINGLRAWAVLAVLCYHFRLPGFGGGFVGVDIFFVISGFLMTGIVIGNLENGSFSLTKFYFARARRIIPALAAVCIILILIGWFVLGPKDYELLAKHSAYTITFLSNWSFWRETGYFTPQMHDRWLLHSWSLSVEFQFYLIFPLVLMTIWRFWPERSMLLKMIATGFAFSFLASILFSDRSPQASFYFLPTRIWEFLAGSLAWLMGGWVKQSSRRTTLLLTLGFVQLALPVFWFDSHMVWPGWQALMPVSGAFCLLLANQPSWLTDNPVMQWLGDRSYSIYLWHWPAVIALVFIGLYSNTEAKLVAFVASFLIAHISYHYIERPMRKVRKINNGWATAVALIVPPLIILATAIGIMMHDGVEGRLDKQGTMIAFEAKNRNPNIKHCSNSRTLMEKPCILGKKPVSAIVLGDSHAMAWMTGIGKAAALEGKGGLLWLAHAGCTYAPGQRRNQAMPILDREAKLDCDTFIRSAERRIADYPPNVPLIIAGRYAKQAFGDDISPGASQRPQIHFSKKFATTTPEFLREYAKSVARSACKMAQQRPVFMIRPVPEFEFDVPRTLLLRHLFSDGGEPQLDFAKYMLRNRWLWATQDEAREQCGIKIIDPTSLLCRRGKCSASINGRPIYHDNNHLSEYGSMQMAPLFGEIFSR